MLDPFEMHPDDKKKIKKKKDGRIDIKEVRKIINKKMKWVKRKRAPVWGYKVEHINSLLADVIKEIEGASGNKNDC